MASHVSRAATLALALYSSVAAAQPAATSSMNWAAGGPVDALERDGNTLYIGGRFGALAPRNQTIGGFGVFRADAGRRQCATLPINGSVTAIQHDGSGGWFLGGRFNRAGATDRRSLVHVLASCAIDTNWTAAVDGTVLAMSLDAGVLYVGGQFTQAGQQGGGFVARSNLAAFSAGTGALLGWNPGADGEVTAIRVARPQSALEGIVIGGNFTQVAGQPRQRLAAVDVNGAATSFVANADGRVLAIEIEAGQGAPNRVWAGGEFQTIGGVTRDRLAAVVLNSGVVEPGFSTGANDRVRAVALSGNVLYVGGDFSQLGGLPRNHAGAVSTGGTVQAFNPDADGPIHAIGPQPQFATAPVPLSAVFLGGAFTLIGGRLRLHAAAVDPSTGVATGWNPSFNGIVHAIAGLGGGSPSATTAPVAAVGGEFDAIGAQRRRNLAAINLDTGELLPWSPAVNGPVRALAMRDHVLYAAGEFTAVNGQARNRLAAFAAVIRVLTPWNPNADGAVYALVRSGDVLYAGGDFANVGGAGRGRAAAIDAASGVVTAWTPPGFDAPVLTVALQGNFVYAGGVFTSAGGAPAPGLVRLDVSNAARDVTWNPAPNGGVRAMCAAPGLLYAGGQFSMAGGAVRSNLAAIDTATAVATAWMPEPNGVVHALSCSPALVYAGGAFTTVGTGGAVQARPRLVGLLPAATGPTGTYATAFRPRALGIVLAAMQARDGVAAGATGDPFTDEDEPVGRLEFFSENFAGLPAPPIHPTAVVFASTVRLRWNPPMRGPRPTAYLIDASTTQGGSNVASGFRVTATHLDVPAVPAGTYYVRIRSVNDHGESRPADEMLLTVSSLCTAPPDPPQDLQAAVAGTQVQLTWTPGSGETVTHYLLEAGGYTRRAAYVTTLPAGDTTFTIAAPPGVYFVRLRSVGLCGLGSASNEVILSSGGVELPPTAPRDFGATVSGSTVTLFWNASALGTVTVYCVYAGSGPDLKDQAAFFATSPTTVTGVPPGTYFVRVHAIGPTGTSPGTGELILVVP